MRDSARSRCILWPRHRGFGSWQDHKQVLCNTRTDTLGWPEAAGAIVSQSLSREILEKRAPDELCKRLHLGLDLLPLSCKFAFRFRARPQATPMNNENWHTLVARSSGSHCFKEFAARNARKEGSHLDLLLLGGRFAFRLLSRSQGRPRWPEAAGAIVSKSSRHEMLEKRAPNESCVRLHLDLLRLSSSFEFRFLARDSGDQKQREPSFQRVRGTKCSKRGLPMSFVYILRLSCSFAFRILALFKISGHGKTTNSSVNPVALGLVRNGFTAPSCFLSCKPQCAML